MPIRDIVLTAFILGTLPFILRRPWIGVLVWTWIGLMNPHKLTWDFAFNFPFAMIVAVTTLLGVVFSSEPKRFPVTPVTVTLLAFIAWMCVSTAFAFYQGDAWEQWRKVMKIQLMILLSLALMQDRERVKWLVWVTVASLGFYGVKGGIFTLRGGGAGTVLGPPGGFIAGNTEISLAITIVVPLMMYLILISEQRWLKWALGIGIGLCAVAVIGTYSRGGLLAIAAMAGFLWLKSRKKLLPAIAVLLVAALVPFVMPERWFERMGTIASYEEDSSARGRINAWGFALNLAKDRPITGGGFETFTPDAFQRWAPNPSHFLDAHSIWFEVLGEHGFVGLALFMLLWVLTWALAGNIIRSCGQAPSLRWARDLAAMVQVSFIGYWVGGTFLGLAYFDLPYILMSLLVLTKAVLVREAGVERQLAGDGATASASPIAATHESRR